MTKLHITIGYDADHKPAVLYLGADGGEAVGIMENPPAGYVRTEWFKNMIYYRRAVHDGTGPAPEPAAPTTPAVAEPPAPDPADEETSADDDEGLAALVGKKKGK